MKLLLANDDGYQAEGLIVLQERLIREGHDVYVCAPEGERSASGQAITFKNPLNVQRVNEKVIYLSGTPADCVKFGLSVFCPDADFVISGINAGANAGVDTLYSGTVGAAMEAVLLGKRALAVSRDFTRDGGLYEAAAEIAVRVLKLAADCPYPKSALYNLNVPARPLAEIHGVRQAFLSEKSACAGYEKLSSGWMGDWYLLTPYDMPEAEPGSDRALLTEGYATVSVLHWNHGSLPSGAFAEALSGLEDLK